MTADVLICGAGPTGLLLAADLARRGVTPRIIDQATERASHSKALAILPRTLEIFEQMGMIDAFHERGRSVGGINVHAGKGKDFYIDFESLDSPHAYILTLPQFETEELLARHVERLGVEIERGVALRTFTDDGEMVHAELAHQDGSSEKVAVPWLAGCDGARSTVRETLGIRRDGGRLERTFVFADALTEWSLPADRTHPVFSASGVIMAIPLPTDGYWRVVLDVPKGHLGNELPELEFFERELSERTGEPVVMSDPQSVTQFSVAQRKATRYRDGRVLVAGDAAHIHSPVGGQGMNTGLQDAYNLGWKLALAIRHDVTPEVIEAYQVEREPVARRILALTNIMTRVATMRGTVKPFIRRRVITLADSMPVAQRELGRLLAGLSFEYPQSPLVSEDARSGPGALRTRLPGRMGSGSQAARRFRSAPAAGALAPDPKLVRPDGAAARLSHLADDSAHTVLLFHGRVPDPEVSRRLERLGRELDRRFGETVSVRHVRTMPTGAAGEQRGEIADPSGACHDAYGSDTGGCYVIRPDRHIGYRSDRADAHRVQANLCRTFV